MPGRERAGDPHRPRGPRPARPPGRLIRRLARAAAAAGAAAVLALLPAQALAHALLLASDPSPDSVLPAPPSAITLRFSEDVSVAGPGITVLAPSGRPVAGGAVRVSGRTMSVPFRAAGEGTYLVRWQVISVDTHPSRGAFTFSVGRTSQAPSDEDLGADVGAVSPAGLVLQALGRFLHLAGMALAFGTIAFRVFILPGAEPGAARRLDLLTWVGVGLLVAAEPVALAGQAVSLGVVAGDLVVSSFGRVLGMRLGAALALWGALDAVRQAGRGRALLLALGVALALVDGLAGHRIAGWPDAASFALGAVHELAMVVWVGGLAAVLVARACARRFGRYALGSFAVLVVSGAVLTLVHLTGPGDLLTSTYGAVLALKVTAVAAAALIAGLGARRLEAAALAGVVALAGLLVSLPPPR